MCLVDGTEVSISDNRIGGAAIEVTHRSAVFITRNSIRIGAGLDEELVPIVGKTFRVGVATDVDDSRLRRVGREIHPPGGSWRDNSQVRDLHCRRDVENTVYLGRDILNRDNVHRARFRSDREQAAILVKGEIGHLFTGWSRLHRLRRNPTIRRWSSPGRGKGASGERGAIR